MLEEIQDRVAYIVLAVAAPAVWFYLMPDFSPLSTRPLGRSITFDELVKPILWRCGGQRSAGGRCRSCTRASLGETVSNCGILGEDDLVPVDAVAKT